MGIKGDKIMRTYRISENEIKGLKPIAVGYKIFNHDWTTKNGNYDYKDKNGNVVGTIHKVDGDIIECEWGLHFSKKPQDCFNFYESVQWNKFAKVEAYDKLLEKDKKCITNILKIVETYTFEDFIRLIQKDLQSKGVSYSKGVSSSDGVSYSYGVLQCDGISRCVFCYNKSGKIMAFNKKITEDRFNEIYKKLRDFCWYPKFNNAFDLKGNLEWYETNIPAIVSVPNEVAWSFMPKEMLEYIKSLPEFNEKIFNKIIGKVE